MQIALNWVSDIINIRNINLDYLVEKLTLGGFEVEEIIELEQNGQKITVLDISATANRSDSLCINGISREMGILLDKPYKKSKYLFNSSNWNNQIVDLLNISIKQSETSLFLALSIKNLTNIEAPNWLKERLTHSGITVEDSLIDYKNFILLETGYPFEFYDLEKIQSNLNSKEFDLTLTNKIDDKEFLATNGIEYELNDKNLLLKANHKTISIAGLIPQKEFGYRPETVSLLIEGAVFNSSFIRKQSRNLGLRTERSGRYEKAIKNNDLIPSLYRLLKLLKTSNPKLSCQLHTFSTIDQDQSRTIILSYNSITQILGPTKGSDPKSFNYINTLLISRYLTRLQFSYEFNSKNLSWLVSIPKYRIDDLTRPIDLIEEIGRLHGFNQFLTRLPTIKIIGIEDLSYRTRKKITTYLLNIGFNELIHYSLVSNRDVITTPIKLINPLLSDSSNMRVTLLPSLIKTIKENLNQGNLYFEGFEYGHTFLKNEFNNFVEKEFISGIFGGSKVKNNWSGSENNLSWFKAKGKIDLIFKQLNLQIHWQSFTDSNYSDLLHPYRSAMIYLYDGTYLGVFGQIHPKLSTKLNLIPELYLFEIDFIELKNKLTKNRITNYKEYSLYPKVIKDISFVINKNINFTKIQNILKNNGTKFLTEVRLLDEYRSDSLPLNHTSLCVQLIFQSKEETLKNKVIDNIINNFQIILQEEFKAQLRN